MKDRFGDQIDLQIHLTDSKEAEQYKLKGATSVFIDGEFVPLDIAMSEEKMSHHLYAKSVH
nr:hypothetical protein [Desulfomonile tiedjei]